MRGKGGKKEEYNNVHFCQCLLLFHNVWGKNCARLTVKCSDTDNWEEVYHSSIINKLDIKCARELHLDILEATMYIRSNFFPCRSSLFLTEKVDM